MKTDFTGGSYEFALGSIKGMRSWKIDEQGRLRGVTHPAIWKPGENVADCKASRRVPGCKCSKCDAFYLGYYDELGRTSPSPRHKVDLRKGHTFSADCECGFWAYDEFSFKEHGDIVGVIAGYGRTTIGTKGFRCEKASILALHRGDQSLSTWLRLQQLYPKVEFFEDYDQMVTKHGGVLKTWDEVGEDFWDEQPPTEVAVSIRAAASSGMQSRLLQLQASLGARTYSQPMTWTVSNT